MSCKAHRADQGPAAAVPLPILTWDGDVEGEHHVYEEDDIVDAIDNENKDSGGAVQAAPRDAGAGARVKSCE